MRADDRMFAVVTLCVVLAVAVYVAFDWLSSGITVEAPQPARVEVRTLKASTPALPEPAPMDTSGVETRDGDLDRLVRLAAVGLSSHPEFASWLVQDRLLRRFVLAVDAVAGGYSPRDEIEFLKPQRAFLVREEGDSLVITASTYRRYDRVTDVVTSLDTAGAAELYRELAVRLESIYAEVAWADEDFDSRFREAVDHLLSVEVPDGPYEVEQRAIVYAFAEDELERLSEAQRQLLRMGPSNARKIQASLRRLRRAIGWPEVAPPVMTAGLDPIAPPPEDSVVAVAEELAPTTGGGAPAPVGTEELP